MNSIWDLAKLVDNYEIDATGATALWPDTTHYKAEVPAGKRWKFLYAIVNRNVSSTLLVQVFNKLDKEIGQILYSAARTAVIAIPNTDALDSNLLTSGEILLSAGWYVYMTFGTAQDASSYASCVVLEVSV